MSTKINLITNASYNFKAPEISADENQVIEVIFPTQESQTVSSDENIDITIKRAATVIDLTVEDDITLTGVLYAANLKIGDIVLIKATATGDDRVLILDAALGGKSINLSQNVEELILLIFDGTSFNVIAAGTGSNGLNGASFLSGAGAPSNSNGADGDHYLNTTNGDLYVKASGTWGSDGNIKGATGNPGADGATFLSGAGAPSNSNGANGDHYLNTTNGEVYKKTTGTWSSIGNITGPAYAPADNSIAVAKLVKGTQDNKTYTLKSTNGTIGWVEDVG